MTPDAPNSHGITVQKQIRVQYYALLREERGTSAERITTTAATARELYFELQKKHGFSLGLERLAVAVNDEFESWDCALNPEDEIVFIPPVAGG
jgi:molybdopterin converting factor subunit 1